MFLFHFKLLASEASSIHLELGEDITFSTQNLNKIWIEKKEILTAEIQNSKLVVKTLNPGTSYLRLGSKLKLITVHPLGTDFSRNFWLKDPDVKVDYCGLQVCAFGVLTGIKDYFRIMNLAATQKAPLLMGMQVAEPLKKEIRSFISNYLRDHGLSTQKIIFGEVWRVYCHPKNFSLPLKNTLARLGIELVTDNSINEQADNIQVAVQMVEINKNYLKKIGINWPTQLSAEVIDFNKFKTPGSFEVALNAAENQGEAKVLASPKLLCRSGKEADFFAGGEFPVKVSNLHTNHIEWKRYGISLKLKPNVDPLGQLNLQIETEISSVDNSLKVDDLPAVLINRVSSFFDLINKKTISLSGLIRSEEAQNSEGLPYLQKIPILGELFKSKNYLENKTELMIFVTPQLINNESEVEL
ncbi:MAG: hypothetical protein ACXWQQ_05705 [Pseudobdellovibrio sp.]